jgi:predicted kinase
LGAGIYSREASAATYRRLGERAREALRAGYPVVVDATFLRRAEREAFRAIAEQLGTPFLILNFHAPQEILRARVTQRLARADDASEADLAVLEHQLADREPLTPAEMAAAFAVDATVPVSNDTWRPVIDRFRRSAAGKTPRPPGPSHPDDETIT